MSGWDTVHLGFRRAISFLRRSGLGNPSESTRCQPLPMRPLSGSYALVGIPLIQNEHMAFGYLCGEEWCCGLRVRIPVKFVVLINQLHPIQGQQGTSLGGSWGGVTSCHFPCLASMRHSNSQLGSVSRPQMELGLQTPWTPSKQLGRHGGANLFNVDKPWK